MDNNKRELYERDFPQDAQRQRHTMKSFLPMRRVDGTWIPAHICHEHREFVATDTVNNYYRCALCGDDFYYDIEVDNDVPR